jgi:hypothetical protein
MPGRKIRLPFRAFLHRYHFGQYSDALYESAS